MGSEPQAQRLFSAIEPRTRSTKGSAAMGRTHERSRAFMTGYEIILGPTERDKFTAQSFLSYLRRSSSHWWDDDQATLECPWLFRGHANAEWTLVPSAVRPVEINPLKPFLPAARERLRRRGYASGEMHKDHSLEIAEAGSMVFETFINLAHSLGMVSKKPDPGMYGVRGLYSRYAGFEKGSCAECLMLAQHHRVPTLLLDWSDTPEIAAHMATADESQENDPRPDIAVYALYANEVVQSTGVPGGRVLFHNVSIHTGSPKTNQYVAAQGGHFTSHDHWEDFESTGIFKSLEDHVRASNLPRVVLRKMILQASEVPNLRRLLDREGYTIAHMMPSLDNIAKTAMRSVRSML
jgi:FRG domain